MTPSQLNFQNDASGALEQFDEFQFFTGLTYLPENCFKGVQGLKTITLPKGLKAVSKNAFRTCTYLERVTLPEGIKSIRDYAFFTNSVLTTINFPASLDSIGAYAFAGDKKLANIEFGGNSVKYIGTYAFSSCKELTSFNFEKVQRINRGAFETAGLTDVVLGENLCHLGQNAFATSHAMTVTLLSSNFEEIDAENTDDPYDYGLHMPITNTNLNLGTQVRIPRQIFHNAYNALTEGRELLHPYIFLDKYSKIDAVPFSCEVPVVLPQGSKIFIVTGLNHTEGEQKAYSRSVTGTVVPENTGVVVHLPDRELYTDQYWFLTANPSATAVGNYSQNIMNASVGSTDLGSPENVVRFSWDGGYNNGEFYYGWMTNPDVYGVDGCSAYLEAPLSDFPSNFAYGSGYPMDLSITGDVTGDGNVDVSDVNGIVNIILGKAQASSFPGSADLNEDTNVDVSDVNAVVNIILGKDQVQPAEVTVTYDYTTSANIQSLGFAASDISSFPSSNYIEEKQLSDSYANMEYGHFVLLNWGEMLLGNCLYLCHVTESQSQGWDARPGWVSWTTKNGKKIKKIVVESSNADVADRINISALDSYTTTVDGALTTITFNGNCASTVNLVGDTSSQALIKKITVTYK